MPGVDGTKFPAGLRVLVVDDDRTCLTILEKMLINCDYKVTKCNRAEAALTLLRENKSGFDVVISDVHMPDMDGFKLLVHIGLELDLPVIMMSADARKSVVMKGVIHGACDYLIKPVRIEELRSIWQHVVRKRKYAWKDLEPSASLDDDNRQQKQRGDSSPCEGGDCKNKRRRKDKENESEEIDDSFSLKKPRVKWTQELHQQFVEAVSHLGINKATPREISAIMNIPGITRQKVGSHLQKFRGFLKRLESQQSNGMFIDNIDAGGHRPVSVHSVSMPLVDQTNTFENPKVEYGNQHENQMNFLHDIPTTLEPRRLAAFKHSFMSVRKSRMSGQTHNLALRQPIIPVSAASQANGFSTLGISSIQQERHIEATQGFVSSHRLLENENHNGIHDLGLQGGFYGLQHNYALNRNITGSGFHIPSLTMDESINYRTSHQHLDHVDDFRTEFFPQQEEGIEYEENEHAYSWYSMDNPPA